MKGCKAAAHAVLATMALGFGSSAMAGEFSTFCSYTNSNLQKCADVIADLVTDKFIARYPAAQFQIFIHSNIHYYSSGGYSAYAMAGVIPKDSAQFPVRLFSNTNINGSDRKFTGPQLAEQELVTYRAAVRNLMERCEASPTCDVYTPRSK